jgi:hypothetical protein
LEAVTTIPDPNRRWSAFMEDKIKFAYMAGILDGEGTITLTREHSRQKRSPSVSVTNTAIEILNIFKETYGGSIISQKTYQEHHKKAWIWKAQYNRAIECIESLYPYLLHPEKKRRASLILGEYKTVTKRNGKYSISDLNLKEDFERRFFHPSTP